MSRMDDHKKAVIEDLTRLYSLAKRSHQNLPYFLKKPTPRVDIPARLAGSETGCRWYWKSRDGRLEVGGTGSVFSSDEANTLSHHAGESPIMFGGHRFTAKGMTDDIWNGFPGSIYNIPRRVFIRENDNCFEAVCLMINGESAIESLIADAAEFFNTESDNPPPIPDFISPAISSKRHFPDYNGWCRNVEKGLAAIKSGKLEKIVLARRTDYQFNRAINPISLLNNLMTHHPESFAFMYQPRPGNAFISMTPERLYRRSDGLLEMDALSSTVSRGATPEEDRRLEKILLENSKLRHEQQLVVDGVAAALLPIIADKPDIGPTKILKLDRIQHLVTPIVGRLRTGIGDSEILKALHPTPAVGGTPREPAVDIIAELEPFDRGWYSGPIGIIAGHQAEFAVGIRSLLIRDKSISVFAGAGIVAGSDPDAEWQEIESKDILHPLLIEQVIP